MSRQEFETNEAQERPYSYLEAVQNPSEAVIVSRQSEPPNRPAVHDPFATATTPELDDGSLARAYYEVELEKLRLENAEKRWRLEQQVNESENALQRHSLTLRFIALGCCSLLMLVTGIVLTKINSDTGKFFLGMAVPPLLQMCREALNLIAKPNSDRRK